MACFVVFEGGDGVGKTTQVELLCCRGSRAGHEVVRTFEPGDTAVGAAAPPARARPGDRASVAPRRGAALRGGQGPAPVRGGRARRSPAARWWSATATSTRCSPTRARAGCSTPAEVEQVARWATDDLRPDLTVLLDLEPGSGVRAKVEHDRLEAAGEVFHERARPFFLELAGRDPERYLVLAARGTREAIAARVAERLAPLLSVAAGQRSRP